MRSNHSLGSATDTKTSSNVVKGLTSGTNVPSVPDSALDGKSPEWSVVAAAVQPTVIAIRVGAADGSGAMGSGVIINAEKGYAVTNNHVVTGAESISVVLADGRIYQAVPRGTDPATDLAVIELVDPPNDLAEAKLGDSEQVVVGEPVMAVGNPLGLDNTVTTGIVSALNRPVNTRAASQGEEPPVDVVTNAIQVDAAVNPGNSGGPLFNAKGEVIGINTSIASLSSPSESAGSIGLAFAIPVNVVANVAGQLIENGTAVHSYLGITPKDAAVEVEGVLRAGAAVVTVQPRTPADEVGLQRGDVVVAVDGKPITGGVSLTAWIRSFDPGDAVTLTVINGNGEARDVDVTLASREDAQQR
jgi:putative serine protease PepD